MNVVFSIIPLLLFVGILFLVVRGTRMKKFSLKTTYWLLIIYIGLLATSMFVVTLFIDGQDIPNKIDESFDDFSLYSMILQGDVEKLEDYVITEKTIDYDKKELYVDLYSPNGNTRGIFIDRNSEYEDDIKVSVYGYVHLYGIDYTNKMLPYGVKFIGSNLVIEMPGEQRFKVASQKNEFTINQFRENVKDFFSSISLDDGVVIITVPEDVIVNASERVYIEEISSN